MRLIYWKAECLDDSNAYSIRSKTKKGAVAKLLEIGAVKTKTQLDGLVWQTDGCRFSMVEKVEVEYDSAFDLLDQVMSEGGGNY